MKVKYELTAKTGTYQKDGQEKSRYQRIGTVFERDDGSLSAKIDCMPVGAPDWNGWVNFFEPRMKEDGYQAAKQAAQPHDGGMDDSIPFNRLMDDQF